MQDIIIDGEFESLLPMLDKVTFESLETELLHNGCRDALVLWNGILIDGHNRYKICTTHNIPFNTIDMEFNSREEVQIWIIDNQVSRRNLTPIQLSNYRGLHYMAEKKIISNKSGKNQHSEVDAQNEHQPQTQTTARFLSGRYKVSPVTIRRDTKVAEAISAIGEASHEARRKLLSSEVSIDKKVLAEMSSWPKEEIEAVAAQIEEGSYEKRKPVPPPQAETGDSTATRPTGLKECNAAISGLTDGFYSEMQKISANSWKVKLRAALKSYIYGLEALSSSI